MDWPVKLDQNKPHKMKKSLLVIVRFLICLIILIPFRLHGQTKEKMPDRLDRREFLDDGTSVSPDPRQIPVAPIDYGPADSLALIGGRVFTGTGEPVKPTD